MYRIDIIPEAGVAHNKFYPEAVREFMYKKLRSIEQELNSVNGVIVITFVGNGNYNIDTEGVPLASAEKVKAILRK